MGVVLEECTIIVRKQQIVERQQIQYSGQQSGMIFLTLHAVHDCHIFCARLPHLVKVYLNSFHLFNPFHIDYETMLRFYVIFNTVAKFFFVNLIKSFRSIKSA